MSISQVAHFLGGGVATISAGANLEGAEISKDQLGKVASLEGATMPDGSKHP